MLSKLIISALLFLLVTIATAQEITKNGTLKSNRYSFSAGYFGYKFSNPGFQLGIENCLATTNNYNVLGSINIYYYNQNNFQSAIAINARMGERFTTRFGLFFETQLGIGIQQTFYTNKTFKYDSGQSTITKTTMGKTGFSPGISLGAGYDFSRKTKYPVKLYLRPSFYWLYPDRNLAFESSYSIEAGFLFTPNFSRKN